MQISELRRQIAQAFELTPESFRQLQRRVPRLMPDGLATDAASALLIVAGMLGRDRDTIDQRATALWGARPITRTGNPLERCESLGACLTLFLAREDVRAPLDYVELDPDIPDMTIVLDKGSRVIFSPLNPRQWKRRMKAIFASGTITDVRRLPRSTFDKVAALIAGEGTA